MRKWAKRAAIGFAALLGFLAVGVGVLYGMSAMRTHARHDVPAVTLHVPNDSASSARGEHIARAIGMCGGCHGADLSGTVMSDDAAFGRLVAPNLTPAGVVAEYTDADWVRAIRHGVRRDGRALTVMPSGEFAHLGDADLGALIAYLKTVPAVTNELPELRLGPIAHFLLVTNKFPVLPAEHIDHFAPREPQPAVAATAEYGRYLASIGCAGCHGEQLQGGPPPVGGPDITPAGRTAGWTGQDFVLALRAGKRPDDTVIDPEKMPWQRTHELTDVEIAALWAYIQELNPQVALRGKDW